ncbi:peptidoglycan editing factor PgeF [Acetivibrio cellulolyticus]|uniref:peptidoglycan editing factor PgeF n=1 Tax=Acetivibrio cellulolyticus TaxID=35830 RepID=UPI0001E2E6E5|nr:peptidoglycan editing factor PgeF [Acetivibrio cellulolyticus]
MEERFLTNPRIAYIEKNGVEYIQFNNLNKYSDVLIHGFTTRRGGVSEGEYKSLNMAFNKNDKRENVEENYRRIAGVLGIDTENMVLSNQVHDNKIRVVTENDRGKGIYKKSDIIGFDGLMTNVADVALVTFYADCVPVFLFDPVKKVISLVHSGWRSTVKEISKEAVIKMKEVYGCDPYDIEVAIGPSIGQCCFEVGEEVYLEFINTFAWCGEFCKKINEKWFIDLPPIIVRSLESEGIQRSKITLSSICTKCNNDVFFSHRGDNGKTGTLSAIMQLKR